MPEEKGTSRRGFLIGGASAVAAAAGGVVVGRHLTTDVSAEPEASASPAATAIPFLGVHQAGIADQTPAHAVFLAFLVNDGVAASAVAQVMRDWTEVAAALSTGDTSVDASLISSGSASGLFTMTVGIGGSFLDRFGIERPAALVDLPVFPGDQLDEETSHGDVFVQLCSDDAIFLSGAVRAVRSAAASALAPKWQFNGFRGVNASRSASNGRNLMGQIDGTNNVATSRQTTGGPIWAGEDSPAWLSGGSYVAVRRFRMLLNAWEQLDADTRDRTVGRHVSTGAPLGQQHEFDPVDLDATDSAGAPVIPQNAHIRLAAPAADAGEQMLRRSYSYSEGQEGANGEEDAGLIFVAYQADPTTSFIPVQQRLAESDALAQYIVATSSALFAILPGVADAQDWFGRALLEGR